MEPVVAPRTFQGRYEVTHLIARGGMAQVYRALDTRLGRHVAVKVLFPELSVDSTFVTRFRREAQAAASLSHPNIVAVYDWGEDAGTYFIVMELVTGTSLATALRAEKTMPAVRAAQIAAQVANGLAYAHRHGVVHRDIKPGNVLITDDHQVKVTDFGIAQAVSTEEGLTMAGSVMGTAAYFSPEQAEGALVDGRSDIYSLGVVLFEALAGRPPFVGDSPVAVASMHVRNAPPELRDLNPAVPEAIAAVTMRALQKSPADRYQTAEEFRADLLRFTEGREVLGGSAVPSTVGATSVMGVQSTSVLGVTPGPTSGPPVRDATLAVPVVAPSTSPSADSPAREAVMTGPRHDVATRKRSSKEAAWLAVAMVVVLIVAAVVLVKGLSGSTTLTMPNVLGLTVAKARTTLGNEGLVVVREISRQSAKPPGTVIRTLPAPNKVVKPKEKVVLVYSLGDAVHVTVPTVAGESILTAENTLQNKGLAFHVAFALSWTAPVIPDTVLEQSITPGTVVLSGSTVVLTVLGADGTYPVPNVSNDPSATAGSTLAKYGLTVGSNTSQCSASVASGNVISTSPNAGTSVVAQTPINLLVSSGACPVSVPNLLGDSVSQANEALAMVQLVGSYNTCPSGEDLTTVQSQSPLEFTMVQPGSMVTATFGCAPGPPPTTTTTL
jgi:serine/threonine-protein kinase